MMGFKRIKSARDPLILVRGDSALVVACDSIGAIGSKELDSIRVDPRLVGRFAIRVPMMEVLSVGAMPSCVSVAICSEPEPTGRLILEGISTELRRARLGKVMRVISSEKNVETSQTAVGVTVVAEADPKHLRIGHSRPNDTLVSLGRSCVGAKVINGHRRGYIADLGDVKRMSNLGYVHECVPVGSKGIIHEASVLAQDSKTTLVLDEDSGDLTESAGPATSILIALESNGLDNLRKGTRKPIRRIGKLI
jgi:hypothetical protein